MTDMDKLEKKLNEDKNFAEKIAMSRDKEELFAKLKEAGFELSEEELIKMVQTADGGLSDDTMEGVTGGSIHYMSIQYMWVKLHKRFEEMARQHEEMCEAHLKNKDNGIYDFWVRR